MGSCFNNSSMNSKRGVAGVCVCWVVGCTRWVDPVGCHQCMEWYDERKEQWEAVSNLNIVCTNG